MSPTEAGAGLPLLCQQRVGERSLSVVHRCPIAHRLLATLPETARRFRLNVELPISVFMPHESIAVLRKHREDLHGDEHDEPLRTVGDHLGHHALAVTLAATYLRKRPSVSPDEVLERLQRTDIGDEANILAQVDATEATAGYGLSVAASLGLHLPDFEGTPAVKLLTPAAFCHPDNIPVDLLAGASGLPREEVEDWLVKLGDVSVLSFDGRTIDVHRLMQAVVRARMDANAMRASLTALVDRLVERFAEWQDPKVWAMQDAYAAHAEAAVRHAERAGGIERASFVANQVGVYSRNRARFDAALSALRRAERIDRGAYGDDHPSVARDVNNIGSVLQAKGDLDGALRCYREAERIDRAAYGDDHPNVAIRVNNIGAVLSATGELDAALKCFRDAEQIDRAAYGDDHPKVAIRVNNIGSVLQDKGDLDGALKCFREAERIDRAAYGDDHPEVAADVNNIGEVLRVTGDLDGALRCYREAERIDRAAYGDDHPEVATDVNNIGTVLQAKGDLDGAREKCTEAFRILLTTVGARAQNTLGAARNLARVNVDPIALARTIAGDAAADALADALR